MLSSQEIEALRHAVNITKAAIHPDTELPIPIPLRMTFFMPSRIPIAMGMIFAPPTVFYTVLFNGIN
jgi:sideroflexin-5